MSENIEWPQDPPQAGDQITIGNTTFAWNDDPGIWVGFVNATTESGGGTTEDLFTPTSTTRVDLNSVTVPAGTWSMHVGLNDNSEPYTLTLPTTNMVGLTASLSGSILGGFVFNGTNYDYAYTKEGTNNDFESRTGQTTIPLFGGLGGGTGISMIFTCSGDVTFSTDEGARWLYTPLNLGGTTTNNNTTVNIGGGGGGGGGIFDESFRFEVASAGTGTYTIPFTGAYRIILSGGGGSGWVSDTGGSLSVGGGGGGGMCYVHAAQLSEGDVVSYTIGTGSSNSGRDSTGSAGSPSTLTVGGLTLTAGAGGGGGIGVGGTGGIAEGGDFRFDGADGAVGNPSAAGGASGGTVATIVEGLQQGLFTNFGITSGQGGGGTTGGTSQANTGALLIGGGHNFTN